MTCPTQKDLKDILSKLNIFYEDPKLIRHGINYVYDLPQANMVLRVIEKDSDEHKEELDRCLRVTSYLSLKTSVLPPLRDEAVDVCGFLTTLWPKGSTEGVELRAKEFGDLLEAIGKISVEEKLPYPDPFAPVYKRLERAVELGVKQEYIDFLDEKITSFLPYYDDVFNSGSDLLHGDAHIGNAVIYHDKLCLIDMDKLSIGHWQYNFVPAVVGQKYMRNKALYSQIVGDRVSKLAQWKYFDKAVESRLITMSTWLAGIADDDKKIAELDKRMTWLMCPDKVQGFWEPI